FERTNKLQDECRLRSGPHTSLRVSRDVMHQLFDCRPVPHRSSRVVARLEHRGSRLLLGKHVSGVSSRYNLYWDGPWGRHQSRTTFSGLHPCLRARTLLTKMLALATNRALWLLTPSISTRVAMGRGEVPTVADSCVAPRRSL